MTDSMKWLVTGTAVVILIGAAIGSRMIGHGSATSSSDPVVAMSDNASGYPAPEVTIASQIVTRSRDNEYLSHSSSLYGDGSSYSRRHRSGKKASHRKAKVAPSDLPTGADPEMGFMPADDKKLRQAEKEASRPDHAMARELPDSGPNGR